MALALASVITISTCGCATSDEVDADSNLGYNLYPTTSMDSGFTSNSIVTDDVNFLMLLKTFYDSNLSLEEVLKTDNNSPLYVSGLYVSLRQSGISDEEIKEYMHNMAVCTTCGVATGDEEWKLLYDKLYSTLADDEQVVSKYYPLARYLHEGTCSLEHEVSEDGVIICDQLLDEIYNDYNDTVLFSNYLINDVKSNGSEKLLIPLARILNTEGIDVVKCIIELENLYRLGIVPRCVDDEEWFENFGELIKTLGEYDSLYDLYYPLAVYQHELKCLEEHYENEFGSIECKTYKLEKDY